MAGDLVPTRQLRTVDGPNPWAAHILPRLETPAIILESVPCPTGILAISAFLAGAAQLRFDGSVVEISDGIYEHGHERANDGVRIFHFCLDFLLGYHRTSGIGNSGRRSGSVLPVNQSHLTEYATIANDAEDNLPTIEFAGDFNQSGFNVEGVASRVALGENSRAGTKRRSTMSFRYLRSSVLGHRSVNQVVSGRVVSAQFNRKLMKRELTNWPRRLSIRGVGNYDGQ